MDPTAALREFKVAFEEWMAIDQQQTQEDNRDKLVTASGGEPTITPRQREFDAIELAQAAGEAAEAADALFSWLAKGGFAPDWSTYNKAV
jgi:hypothetical protein